jgi:hypothetical protein
MAALRGGHRRFKALVNGQTYPLFFVVQNKQVQAKTYTRRLRLYEYK